MNCPECQELLQQRLDGRATADRDGLERHLRDCPECRERHAAARRLVEALPRLPRPAAPPDLAARIVGRVLAEHRDALRFRRRVLTWAASAAAVLLLALAGYGLFRPGTGKNQGPQIANNKQPPAPEKSGGADRKEPPSPKDLSLGQAFEEASKDALSLTRRTAKVTVAQARHLLPQAAPFEFPFGPGKATEPLTPVLEPPAESLKEAGQSVTAGLRPVTNLGRRAVNLFLGDFGGSGPSGL